MKFEENLKARNQRWQSRVQQLGSGYFLALGFALCVHVVAQQAASRIASAEIRQRATNEFAVANLFKPAGSQTNDASFALAPLIIQEVPVAEGGQELSTRNRQAEGGRTLAAVGDQFGTVSMSNRAVAFDNFRPGIYSWAETVLVKGRNHSRVTYVWFYRTSSPDSTPPALPVQGVRLTLDGSGRPAICEVLAHTSGAELIFVTQSLDTAAQAEFSKPLPGRKYSIERDVSDAPNVVVARVIDDGPVAMGPIVYLDARARDVSTLICRCMPAQVRKILTTRDYYLVRGDDAALKSLLTTLRAQCQTAFWPGGLEGQGALEKRLRLPSSF